ncbi:hypothetical protein JG688_00010928 [Phytophthora aleatoria]|uniref:M96 mating-specific protein family n=1 Tax=Phytophthora aleatoria TaxID=2496075 RepID=A0A8J5IL58_9STRA|nr:hypothetical protein JG688_00010928 [Phytophthora aleatoria]
MAFLLEGETDETLAAALAFLDEQQKSLTPSLQEPLELSDDSPALPSLDDPEAADILDDLSPELPAPADKAIKNISWTATIPTPKLLSQRLFKSRQVVPCSPPQPALAKPAKTPSPTQKKKKKPYVRKKPLSYNPNKARDERKLELIYLRQKVADMEMEFQKLQEIKEASRANADASESVTALAANHDSHSTNVFEVLLAGVEASYREVDAVFEATGLGRTEAPKSDAQMRDGVNGMYLEIFANKMLPFGMHATGEAVWQHFKGTDIPYRWFHSKSAGSIESTEDTMVESFGMDMYDAKSNTKAEFNVKQILRRYVEEDRVVVVWRSHIMPLEFSNKRFAGIHFQEKGYVVIKPRAHSDNSSDDDDFTLVQTCYIITPDLSDQSLNDDAKTGALTEFVLSSTASNISASHEMIENVLLDQALRQRKRRE